MGFINYEYILQEERYKIIEHETTAFFMYVIKWFAYKNQQNEFWVNKISESSKAIYDLINFNRRMISHMEDDYKILSSDNRHPMLDCFGEAKKLAILDKDKEKYTFPHDPLGEIREHFKDIRKIASDQYVKNWLLENIDPDRKGHVEGILKSNPHYNWCRMDDWYNFKNPKRKE